MKRGPTALCSHWLKRTAASSWVHLYDVSTTLPLIPNVRRLSICGTRARIKTRRKSAAGDPSAALLVCQRSMPSLSAFLPAPPAWPALRGRGRGLPPRARSVRRPRAAMRASAVPPAPPPHAYAAAPMMDVTDRHWRALARLISRRATLYTEMVVDRTLIFNEAARDFELRLPRLPDGVQHSPVVLQLGGSVPEELAAAAKLAAGYGYDEVNLNCGCPSPKVAGKGCFGAALMRHPSTVADACRRMAAELPDGTSVTVKCRLGVDDDDSYEQLVNFVRTVSEVGGVRHFIVHARKAILSGLSPAQNRSVPPLRHELVYQLREDFPALTFSINGGIREVDDVCAHLARGAHGVMVGRGCMDSPWAALRDVDTEVYGDWSRPLEGPQALTRRNVLAAYIEYAEGEAAAQGTPTRVLVKPLLNLFYCEPKGKIFRRTIDTLLKDPSVAIATVIADATAVLPAEVLDAPPPSVTRRIAKDRARDTPSPQGDGTDVTAPAVAQAV